ncbi:MAG TPA: histidine phosphatase family protein [Caulobacteraceae bacterium]|nr:histidine phosphatase family protein [Caulobacteraceae bacterium]
MADGVLGDVAEAAERPGAVILARHGEPALSRQRMLCADEYREWWADYEVGGLAAGQAPPVALVQAADRAGFIIASTRPRSVETARALACGRAFAEDALFIEAPLPPPHWPHWVKLSPRIWGFVARLWWWMFNHHDHQETRAEAEARADEAARQLVALASSGQDVLLVAHGFFNAMIGQALARLGWRCVRDGGFRYWAARRFESQQR